MDNFIQEIEEDLRHDRYMALWQKYGRYAVAVALILIIAVAGFISWRHYRNSERLEDSMAYNAALSLADQGGAEAALPALRGIVESGSDSYAALARLQEAALLSKAGKTADAAAVYETLADDANVDPLFRDLAALLHVMITLDSGDPQQLGARLVPLAAADNPWRFSALELQGLLAWRAGDDGKAREIYASLADDPTTPRQLRGRAAEMLAFLGPANG